MKKINITLFTSLLLFSSINFNSYAYTKKDNSKSYMSSPTFKKINFNPYAPEDYDKNFKEGDIALVPYEDSVKEVIIKERLESTYAVYTKQFGSKGPVYQYKFNSVYPYFDLRDFNEKTRKYRDYIIPHLKSYAKKFNLKEEQVTYFPDNNYYSILNVEEFKDKLAKLEELNKVLDSMQLPENNHMIYLVNPSIWKEIASNSKEYMNSLLENPHPSFADIIKSYTKDIQETKDRVEKYDGTSPMFVNRSEWAWRAVSKKERASFYSNNKGLKSQLALAKLAGSGFDPFKQLNEELDLLSDVIDKNLHKLKSDSSDFKFRDSESEKVFKNYLPNLKSLKIIKLGMKDKDWRIEKNGAGMPICKYKYGAMIVDDPKDDVKYCKTIYFMVQKDYEGGGRYGSSKITRYHEELLSCK